MTLLRLIQTYRHRDCLKIKLIKVYPIILGLIGCRHKDDTVGIGGHAPVFSVNLKGCEVTPCVNIAHQKYAIKLAIPSPDGMSDLWIKCATVKLLGLINKMLDELFPVES